MVDQRIVEEILRSSPPDEWEERIEDAEWGDDCPTWPGEELEED